MSLLVGLCMVMFPQSENIEVDVAVNAYDIVWVTPYNGEGTQSMIYSRHGGADTVTGTVEQIVSQINEECNDD